MANEYDSLIDDKAGNANPVTDYDDLVVQQEGLRSESLKQSMFSATEKNPDAHSNVIKLSEKTGLPADTVERNLPEVQKKVQFESTDYDELLKSNPVLAEHLSDKDFAAIAHDDIDNLSFWEKIESYIDSIGESFSRGNDIVELSRIRNRQMLQKMGLPGDNFALNVTDEEALRAEELSRKINASNPEELGFIPGTLPTAAEQLPILFHVIKRGVQGGAVTGVAAGTAAAGFAALAGQAGPQVLLPEEVITVPGAFLAGGRVGFMPGFKAGSGFAAFELEGGLAYDEFKSLKDEEGNLLDENLAATGALFVGSVNAALEYISLAKLGKTFEGARSLVNKQIKEMLRTKTGREAFKSVMKRYAESVATEGVTEFLQELTNVIGGELLQSIDEGSFKDADLTTAIQNIFSEETLDRTLAAGKKGVQAALVFGLPGSAISTFEGVRNSDKAKTNKQILDDIGEKSKSSKLRKRQTGKYQSYVKDALNGTGVENVGIPANKLKEFFQENPDSYIDFSDNIPGFEDSYAEAQLLGGDVAIPTDILSAHIADKDYYATLSDDIRIGDAMTIAEAKEFDKDVQDRLISDYEKFASYIDDVYEGQAAGNKVFEDVKRQLLDAGQVPDIAEKNALLHKAFFETMAVRTGIDAFSLYQGQNLRIRSESTADPLDSVIDMLRKGKGPTERQTLGPTLIEFLRDAGGLRDDGGELSARDLGSLHKGQPFVKNIIQENGLELDAAVAAAVDAGFIPAPDENAPTDFGVNELLDLIDNEIAGNPLYSENLIDNNLDNLRTQIEALNDMLGQAGLDINEMTNQDVKDFIDGLDGLQFDQAAQVGTKEFKKWFGDSKVVDENGDPLVVYHGTDSDFDSFNIPSKGVNSNALGSWEVSRHAAFFAVDKELADEFSIQGERKPKPLIEVYLSIQNPLDLSVQGFWELPDSFWEESKLNPRYYRGLEKSHTWEAFDDENGGKDLVTALKVAGYDGIKMQDYSSGDVQDTTSYAVFNPTQIKSATGNRGTFDPNDARILFQSDQAGEDRNLYVAHNITAENVLHSEEIGGLAAPSLAVLNINKGAFDSFGEITLIADPSMLESSKARTFDADVYSPRHPTAKNIVSREKFDSLIAELDANKELSGDLRQPDADSISDRGERELIYSDALKFAYLKSLGKEPSTKKTKTNKHLRDALKIPFNGVYSLMQDEAFKKIAAKQHEDYYKARLKTNPELADIIETSPYDEDGNVNRRVLEDFAIKVRNYIEAKGVDTNAMRAAVDKKLRNKKLADGFESYASKIGKDLVVDRKLFKGFTYNGNRKYIPYTLDNIVKEMTRSLRGGEGFNYGAGSVRSAFANEMKSIKAVQKRRNQLVTKEQMNAIRDESQNKLSDALDELRPYYKYDADRFGYMDDASSAIAEGPRGWNEAFNMDQDSRKIITDLIDYLKNLPTEYFETKVQRAVDVSEFVGAVVPKGANKEAVDVLKSKGLKISYYKGGDNESRIKAVSKFKGQLFQDVPRGANRGRIVFTGDSTIIDLFKDANLSTFLHESGHLFLNAFAGVASQQNAPQQIQDDMSAILDWLGVDSIEELDPANNGDAAVQAQEKWARGIEAYLREGNAPSARLQAAFQRFKSWLVNVYRSIKGLNVELNDEIRQVMDRMLATDDEIRAAQDRNRVRSVFASAADAGMTEEQFNRVNQVNADAVETAKEKLLAKLLKEITREKKQWWKDQKSNTRDEVEAEYQQRKDFKAKNWLQYGKLPDGSELGIEHSKLSRDALVSMYGDRADSLWRKLPFGKNSIWVSGGGIHPDVAAAMFGYQSGDQLVNAIIKAGNMKAEIAKEVDRRMMEKYGDILNDGSIEAEADEAMHNINSVESMLSDINALNQKTGRGQSPKQVFKNIANQIIGKKKVSEIRPSSILENERRVTDRLLKAIAAGDNELALQLANQRLINHYMYMAAREAKTRIETIQKYMGGIVRRKYNPKQVDPDYINQLKLLASMYDFRKGKPKEVLRAQQRIVRLVEWINAQQEAGNAVYTPELISPDLARVSALIQQAKDDGQPVASITSRVNVNPYSDMTLGDLEDVFNTAKHLRFIGGKNSEKAREELRAEAQALADSITINGKKDVENITDKSWFDKAKEISLRFSFDQIKLLSDIRLFDGYKDFGPMFNAVYQKVVDGTNKRIEIDLDAAERIKDIFKPMEKQLSPKNDIRTIQKDGGAGSWSLSLRQRVMLAVYWGSPESRDAILKGHQVSEADVQKMLDTMTDEQIDFVEKIWEFNESYWPELSRIETTINGVPPVKVDHVPFTINGRQVAGGYHRLYYEWSVKDKFKIDMHDEAEKMMHSNRVTQSKTGAVISRVGSGGRMVKLDPDNFFRAIEDNLQFIAFAEASREVARIVQHPTVASAIVQKYGKDRFQSFVDSLDGVFAGSVATNNSINSMLRGVRTNLTYGYLALSFRNMLVQPIALTNAMGAIGEGEVLKAVADVYMRPSKYWNLIKSKSVYMQQRNKFVNREAAEQLANIKGSSGIGWKPRWAFVLQTMGDAIVTYPTWLAAYRQGVKKFSKPGVDPDVLEKMAVTYADEMTASTVGSGLSKDLAPLFQGSGNVARVVGSETVKQLTFMGSFFNMQYNLYYDAWKRFDTGSPKSSLNFVREMMWYSVIPGMLSAWAVGDGPDEEDDEGYWEWAIKATAEFGFSSSMFWRNMVSTLKGFEPSIPALQFFKGVGRAGNIGVDLATGEKEFDGEVGAKLIRSFEPMLAMPGAGQAARTLEYLDSYDQGDEGEFSLHGMLIEGKER